MAAVRFKRRRLRFIHELDGCRSGDEADGIDVVGRLAKPEGIGWAKASTSGRAHNTIRDRRRDGGHGRRRPLAPPLHHHPVGGRPSIRFRGPPAQDRPICQIRLCRAPAKRLRFLQEIAERSTLLHIGEVQAEAHMRAAAERHPGKAYLTVAMRHRRKNESGSIFGGSARLTAYDAVYRELMPTRVRRGSQKPIEGEGAVPPGRGIGHRRFLRIASLKASPKRHFFRLSRLEGSWR